MTRKYTFETKEINGETYAIATGQGRNAEPIRVRADWVESDDIEGKWEDLIKQVVQPETIDEIDIADGSGGISRREAVHALAGAEVDGTTIVSSESQADALVEYLDDEGIIDIEGDTLVLFKDPDAGSLDGTSLMNWAALMAAVIESIDEHIQRVEDAKEKFEETLASLETDPGKSNDRLLETGQRLRSLGPGQDVPDPEDLDPEERQEYKRLKSHYLYLRNMEEAKQQNFFQNIDDGSERMGQAIERLEAAKEVYQQFHRNVRKAATQKQVFPQEAMQFVKNAGNLITDLAGVEQPEAENVSADDLDEMIANDHGETAQQQAEKAESLADGVERAAGTENIEL